MKYSKALKKIRLIKQSLTDHEYSLLKKESVVRLHGAHIRAENISGTNFHISFPKKMI